MEFLVDILKSRACTGIGFKETLQNVSPLIMLHYFVQVYPILLDRMTLANLILVMLFDCGNC